MVMNQKIEAILLISLSFLVFCLLSLLIAFNVISIYIIVVVLLYTLLGPLLGLISDARIYFALLPIPYAGIWLISLLFFFSLGGPYILSAYSASAISALMVTFVHLFSRMKNLLFNRFPLSRLSRIFFTETALIFLFTGLFLLGIEPVKLEPFNKVIFYGILSVFYCMSSLTYVNFAYRYRLLCRILNVNKVENKIVELSKRIEEKFPEKSEDIGLLRYYYLETVRLFTEGSYEVAYVSAYKIIETLKDIESSKHKEKDAKEQQIVSDKREKKEDKPSRFSSIRGILVHSTDPKKAMGIRAKLPDFTLEIIQKATEFIEELAA